MVKPVISIFIDCGPNIELVEMENQPQNEELVMSEETTLMPEPFDTGKPKSCSNPFIHCKNIATRSDRLTANIFESGAMPTP